MLCLRRDLAQLKLPKILLNVDVATRNHLALLSIVFDDWKVVEVDVELVVLLFFVIAGHTANKGTIM
jgi:hypothetical protein